MQAAIKEKTVPTNSKHDVVIGMCGICPAGCGVEVHLLDGRIDHLKPLKKHPQGIVCPRGMQAKEMTLLGEFYLAPGYSDEYMYVFLARQLSPGPLDGDDDEFLSVEPILVDEAYRMADSGRILDGKTLAALLLARPHLLD